MSRVRLIFLTLLATVAVLWVGGVMVAASPRLEYRALIAAIRKGESVDSPQVVARAIADYRSALRYVPCQADLHLELLLLLAYDADARLATKEIDAADQALGTLEDALIARLSCDARDGKAWLDVASVGLHRHGMAPDILKAYRMSAEVSPGESWLAQKRLIFILPFRQVLDEETRKVATQDIEVLKRAHPNRLTEVMQVAEVDTPEALLALFKNI